MSKRWSATSPTCRLDWRPSRLRAACLVLVGVLAAVSLPMTALPGRTAIALGIACVAWALGRAWHDLRQAPGTLVLDADADGGGATWTCATTSIALVDLSVGWRGPLAGVSGRDPAGKLRHLAFWPDTLPAPARRALRLAAGRSAPPRVPLLST
jgi:toxin CptA